MSGEILENYSQNIFFNRSFVIRRNSCFGFHKRRACGITDLPRNILINIFQYFNEEELRKNIIPVSNQYFRAFFNNNFYAEGLSAVEICRTASFSVEEDNVTWKRCTN